MNFWPIAPANAGTKTITEQSIKIRILNAAKELFADRGFAGSSVRAICAQADASVPMINHYFGSKKGLYEAILKEFSTEAFAVPIRIIEGDIRSRDDFLTKMELFISETFRALCSQASIFRIISREGSEFADLGPFHQALAAFLQKAQEGGFLRSGLDPAMVTGLVLDRLGNQVLFSVSPQYKGPNVLSDADFREAWLKANIDVLLNGLAGA